MIKIIVFQDKQKGFRMHAIKRIIKDGDEDDEYKRAIEELQFLRGENGK